MTGEEAARAYLGLTDEAPLTGEAAARAYLAHEHVEATPEKTQEHAREAVRTIPPKDPEALQRKIDAGMLPMPTTESKVLAALGATEPTFSRELAKEWRDANDAATAAIRGGANTISAGMIPRLAEHFGSSETGRAMGFPAPGTYAKTAEMFPRATLAGNLAGALGGGAGIGGQTASAVGRGARQAVERVAPGLPQAAKVGVEAATGGASYSAADAALRGESPADIGKAAVTGGGLAAAFGMAPAALGAAESGLQGLVTRNDLRSVKQMAKKGSLDKALSQFGAGDPEEGARRMAEFVQREGIGPMFRAKGDKMVSQLENKRRAVWDEDLKPIYENAKEVEPTAAASMDEIASRLRAQVRQRGGNEAELVEKAIAKLHERNLDLRSRGGVPVDEMPLDVLLTNARDFQSQGHAGVVNYDAPTQLKMAAREIGRTLRNIANERVARIYERNPEAAQALIMGERPRGMGVTFRDQPSTPGTIRADQYPDAWARRYQDFRELAADVPRRLAEGNKRYSDYASLEPLAVEAAKLKAGEKHFGLISLLKHGTAGTAAALLGHTAGGPIGAAASVAGMEGAKAAMPWAVRQAQRGAGSLSGEAVAPQSLAPMSSLASHFAQGEGQ